MRDVERQSTHFEDCWRNHTDCAVARIEQLEAQIAALVKQHLEVELEAARAEKRENDDESH